MAVNYNNEHITKMSCRTQKAACWDKELVLERWHQRSSELCPDGYSVIKSETKEEEINTAFFSGGVLVPFSTVHPEAKGEIQCKQS